MSEQHNYLHILRAFQARESCSRAYRCYSILDFHTFCAFCHNFSSDFSEIRTFYTFLKLLKVNHDGIRFLVLISWILHPRILPEKLYLLSLKIKSTRFAKFGLLMLSIINIG